MSDDPEVAVLGGGMSGLCAAVAVAEAGARVVVLEAAAEPGGSMAMSGGLIWTARDLAAMRREIPRGDASLQELLVRELDTGWRWLEARGVPLEPEAPCMVDGFGRGRMMALGAPGDRRQVATTLARCLRELGGSLRTGSRALGVAGRAGDFTVRVRDESDGRIGSVSAAAVIFTGGGFQNDLALLRNHVTPYARDLVVRSNRYSDGVAVRSAAALGVALSSGMYSFYGHSLPVTSRPLDPSDFMPAGQFYSNHCAVVNTLGLRFTDETWGLADECNAQAGARQPGARYFLIFDEFVRRTHVSAGEGLPGVVNSLVTDRLAFIRDRGGQVYSASSLPDLAARLQAGKRVPARNLLDTLQAYNAGQTTPSHPGHAGTHHALCEPPFYAVECAPGITYTMGGLAVDDELAVLDRGGSPVAGLFAAGADAGHVFEDVYGGGLAWALVSGVAAGRGASDAVSRVARPRRSRRHRSSRRCVRP